MKVEKELKNLLEDEKFRKFVLLGSHHQYWDTWLKANPEKKQIFLKAREFLLDLQGENWREERKENLLQQIKVNIADLEYKRNGEKRRKRRLAMLSSMFFFLLAILVSTIYFNQLRDLELEQPLAVSDELITRSVPIGQKSRMVLPDGSAVTLNSSSHISYEKGFGSEHRKLSLQGEGFFEVAKDTSLAFEVEIGQILVTALGTSFNIRAYDLNSTSVQLASGSVSVASEENQKMFLNPGQQASLSKGNGLVKSDFSLQKAFKWKEGILVFESNSWQEVIVELERWYGVDISISGRLPANQKVTAEFNRDFLSNVLNSLSYSFDFTYEIQQNQVQLKFN